MGQGIHHKIFRSFYVPDIGSVLGVPVKMSTFGRGIVPLLEAIAYVSGL